MKAIKGDIFYHAWLSLDSSIREKSEIVFEEWHVTSIDKRGIFLKKKCDLTWGKLSKAHHDYGWLTGLSKFAREYCSKLIKAEEFNDYCKKHGFFKSKSAAYRSTLPQLKKTKREVLRILSQVERAIDKEMKLKKCKKVS